MLLQVVFLTSFKRCCALYHHSDSKFTDSYSIEHIKQKLTQCFVFINKDYAFIFDCSVILLVLLCLFVITHILLYFWAAPRKFCTVILRKHN